MRKSAYILAWALCIGFAGINSAPPVQAQKSPKLAKCNGSKKRSANPYGTVLPTLDVAALKPSAVRPVEPKADINVFAVPRTAPIAPANEAAHKVPEISQTTQSLTFASC